MKKYLSAILIAGVLWSLAGCGSSSNDGTTGNNENGNNPPQVVVKDAQSAKNSYAVLGEAVGIMDVTEDVSDYTNFLNIGAGRALETVHEGSYACAVSGSVDHVIKKDTAVDPVQYDVTMVFNQCKMQPNTMWDGKATYKGSKESLTINYQEFTYSEEGGENSGSVTLNTTVVLDVKSESETEMTYNGTVTRTQPNMRQRLRMENFVINVQKLENQDLSLAVDGKVTLSSNPATCADGAYTIETIERVVVDHTSDDPVSGKVKVNGTEYTFNGDGTVTAIVNGQHITFDQDVEDINCSAIPQS